MTMHIREEKEAIVIEGTTAFDPEQIFECGQAFHWVRETDGSYTTVAFDEILNLRREGERILLTGTTAEKFHRHWHDYFDLATDYESIHERLSGDAVLQKAIEFGRGIRLLNQPPFETTISFIISANKQISGIKNSVFKISEHYGNYLGEFRGRPYFSFPTAERLAEVDPLELKEICRVGYRNEWIVKTARMIHQGDVSFEKDIHLPREELRDKLLTLPGVGKKVADCILLFSLKKRETFPVDVWVERTMKNLYSEQNTKDIGAHAEKLFGKDAGYAQQYIFYYGRENKLGR